MMIEFAKSLSGHDKNQFYYIWKREERAAYLVNGSTHRITNPKKKNEKHFQTIHHLPAEIADLFVNEGELTDAIIRGAIKKYEKLRLKEKK